MQSDLDSAIKEKNKLQERIDNLNKDITSLKDKQSDELAQQQTERSTLEQKLRESNLQIKTLESQKNDLQKQSDKEIEDLNSRISSLKNDMKKAALEKDTLVKKVERIVLAASHCVSVPNSSLFWDRVDNRYRLDGFF